MQNFNVLESQSKLSTITEGLTLTIGCVSKASKPKVPFWGRSEGSLFGC